MIDKQEAVKTLLTKWTSCQLCPFGKYASVEKFPRRVFFKGNLDAGIFLLGEGPGGNEIKEGRPFVGKAGEQLVEMLGWTEIPIEDCIVANTMVCSATGKEKPTEQSLEHCKFWLDLYDIVKPKIAICLGAYAARVFFDLQENPIMKNMINEMLYYEPRGIMSFVEYHPAYLLRNPSAKTEARKRWVFIGERYRQLV